MSYDYYSFDTDSFRYISHHGIKGQRWGVRRYQNPDGTLTNAGKQHVSETASANTKSSASRRTGTQARPSSKRSAGMDLRAINWAVNGTSGSGGIAGAVMDAQAAEIESEIDELLEDTEFYIAKGAQSPSGVFSEEYQKLASTISSEVMELKAAYAQAKDNREKQRIVKEMRLKKKTLETARNKEIEKIKSGNFNQKPKFGSNPSPYI